MPTVIDFEVWKQMYADQIEKILHVMIRYMNTASLPKHIPIDYFYHENLDPRLLKYIYEHSSSKFIRNIPL